jgi:hypothetical protein
LTCCSLSKLTNFGLRTGAPPRRRVLRRRLRFLKASARRSVSVDITLQAAQNNRLWLARLAINHNGRHKDCCGSSPGPLSPTVPRTAASLPSVLSLYIVKVRAGKTCCTRWTLHMLNAARLGRVQAGGDAANSSGGGEHTGSASGARFGARPGAAEWG